MTSKDLIPVALVGIGKIARDQHIPSINGGDDFTIQAAVSRNGKVENVENYEDFDAFLAARPDVVAVSLCTPPDIRFAMAKKAIAAGKHVLKEKPPATTIGEAETLSALAREKGVTLFATWHSRFAHGVEPARKWLEGRRIDRVTITWKEDVRRWHPGQAWIWEAGGFGVFDPGINALSILTALVPGPIHVLKADLYFPSNRQQPIAADLEMESPSGTPITAAFDWRQEGPQTWDIVIESQGEILRLSKGGAEMYVNDQPASTGADREYAGIYERFAELIRSGESDADYQPLRIVADAFLRGARHDVEPFVE